MNVVRPRDYDDAELQTEESALAWLPVLLSFLLRSWRGLAVWTSAALAVGIAFLLLATPQFTADAELLIDTRQASGFRQQSTGLSDPLNDNAIVESQVEVLRSTGLARSVVQKLKLADDPEVAAWSAGLRRTAMRALAGLVEPTSNRAPSPEDAVTAATEELQARIGVRRIGLSNVVQLAVTTPSAARSAQFANALTAAYVEASLGARYDITRQAGLWLQDRLRELRDQSIAADQALQQLRARIGLVDTDKGGFNEQQLGDLGLQLANAHARVSDAAARYERIQAITAAGVTTAASGSVSDALQNTVIQKLQQQYLDDARKLAEWTGRYGAGHAAVTGVRNEMAELQRSLGSELNRIQEAYRSDYDVARSNEAAVQKQIDSLVAVSTAANNQRVQVRAMESLAETYRNLYASFLQRYTQAAQDQSFPISEARVITAAVPPLGKSRPQTLLVLLAAAAAGLCLGTAAGFVREVMDRRIQTTSQLRALTGLEVLASLPVVERTALARVRPRPARPGDAPPRTLPTRPAILRWVVEHPFSPYGEALRGLRVRLGSQRVRSRPVRVIGVVSAGTGEGRTAVAANLAQAMAAAGQRVVLVDADHRRPQLSRWWVPDATQGFTDLLRGTAVAEVAWRDAQTGLTFLPAGEAIPATHPSDLFTQPAFTEALEHLKSEFQYVVLDLPSLANPADAYAASTCVDGFIVVVEWARTQEAALVDGLVAADIDAGRLLGAVMNRVDMKALRRLTRGTGNSFRAYAPAAIDP